MSNHPILPHTDRPDPCPFKQRRPQGQLDELRMPRTRLRKSTSELSWLRYEAESSQIQATNCKGSQRVPRGPQKAPKGINGMDLGSICYRQGSKYCNGRHLRLKAPPCHFLTTGSFLSGNKLVAQRAHQSLQIISLLVGLIMRSSTLAAAFSLWSAALAAPLATSNSSLPRLAIYFQTTHDSNGNPISMLPLIQEQGI